MAQDPPAQQQDPPGTTDDMDPRPRDEKREHVGTGLLAAEPDEIAPSFVVVASNRLSGCYSGEVLAPIGGETLPG